MGRAAVIDGYKLYDLIANGSEQAITIGEDTYQFQFKGMRCGSSNWLEVNAESGESQKWGWGWNSEICWHCLSDLEQGWKAPRKHPYKPYGEHSYDDD